MNPLRVQEAQQVIQQHQLANQQSQKQMDIAQRMERAYQSALDRTHAASVNAPVPQATSPAPEVSEAAPPSQSGGLQSGSGLSSNSEASAQDVAPAVATPPVVESAPPSTGEPQSLSSLSTNPPATVPARPIPTAQPPRTASPADSWNGAPPGFYSALEQEFYKNGLGAQVPGMQKAHAELGIQVSKNVSDAMLAHQQQAEAATALLQGIANLPAQQQDIEYQKILPQFTSLERQMGSDVSQVPQHWDNNAMGAYIAQGFKVQEYANHLHQAAQQAEVLHRGVLADAPKAAEYFQKELAGVSSPTQYSELRQRISNLAEAEKTADPKGTSFYQQVLDKNPREWNQGMQRQATLASMPAQDRPTYLQHDFANTAQRLSAAAQQGPQQYAAQLAAAAPEDRPLFDQKWTKDTAESARRTGLTASQVGVEDLKNAQLDVSQLRAQFAEALANAKVNKLNNPAPTAAEQKNSDMALARQALQAHNGNFEAALADINKTEPDGSYTYYNGHGIDERRGAVSQALQNIKTQGLKDADTAARTGNAQARTEKIEGGGMSTIDELNWKRAHPGQPVPSAKPGAAAPPVKQAQPQVATSTPAAAPAAPISQLHLNPSNGQIAEFVNGKWDIRQGIKSGAGWMDPKSNKVIH